MSTTQSKTQREKGARPTAAVELTPEGILAAALPGRNAAPVYAFAPLPVGAIVPGISEINLINADAVSKAIATALNEVAPGTQSVTLLVPDSSVRVFVLDFDSLPAKPAEAVPVIKFRLRKLVPFDAEHAGVSYQMLTETKDECRVLIAVMPGALLTEYEAAVRAAGYEPGAVLPSGLAALAMIDSAEPALIACLGPHTLTTAITNGEDLLLYRTVDLPASSAAQLTEIQRDVAVATAFFEDKIGARAKKLYYSGTEDANTFARLLADPSLEVTEFASRPATGAATTLGKMSFAGIDGALAGAA